MWLLWTAVALEIAPELQTSGWNNQRESLVAGAVFARAMNRTLVLPSQFNPTSQNHDAYDVDALIDVARLQEHVRVSVDNNRYDSIRRDGRRIEFDVHCPGLTEDQVRRAGDRDEPLFLAIGYVYEDVVFKHNLAYSSAQSMEVYKYLRPHRSYYECAMNVVAAIGAKISVHLRVGGRILPAPLMDCEAHGYVTVNHEDMHCQDADGSMVEMAHHVRATSKNSTIYVATNSVDDNHTVNFLRHMRDRPVFTYGNVSSIVSSKCRIDDVSLLEQTICAVTDRYYATFYSSWDEWVLHLRQRMSLRDDMALALFISKTQARSLRRMRMSYQTECSHSDFTPRKDGILATSCLCHGIDESQLRTTYRLKDLTYGHLQRYGKDTDPPATRLPVTFSSPNLHDRATERVQP